ncbi:MAG: hypothetical protein ACLRWQ_19655 [Flavonifractor plautii]
MKRLALSGRRCFCCGGLRGGAHGGACLEDITDADIVANEMGYLAVSSGESSGDTFSSGELGELPRGGVPLDPAGKRSADDCT